jgi:hypothetical protein
LDNIENWREILRFTPFRSEKHMLLLLPGRVQRIGDSSKIEIPYFGIMTSGFILENRRFLINPPYITNDV